MESKQGYLVHKVYRLEKGSSFIAHNVEMAKLQHEGWKKVVAKESRTTEASALRMTAGGVGSSSKRKLVKGECAADDGGRSRKLFQKEARGRRVRCG